MRSMVLPVECKMAAPYLINFTVFLLSIIYCKTDELKHKDSFREEVFVKPLPSGHVYSYFQFTTVWNTSSELNPYQHCHLFPRALGEILTRHNVQELHISLTAGLWRHEKWGYPVYDAPPGAEIWVWFKKGTEDIDRTWKKLTSSLSGLLCASLNFIDGSNSITPHYTFRHTGVVGGSADPSLLKYGTLPKEIVCTENLTPWKKLLPCDSKRGLAALLNAGHIHSTNYHSLGIHVRDICRDRECQETSIELKQTVSLVYDLVILNSQNQDFTFRKLFGSGIPNRCPLAEESKIYIDTTSDFTTFELTPEPTHKISSIRGGTVRDIAVYDLKNFLGMFNIAVKKKKDYSFGTNNPPLLFANRYISGYGRQKGGIVTKVYNRHWKSINVIVLENLPWFVPVYLHTLKIVSNGVTIKPAVIKYIPGRQRVRPTHLELLIQLPSRSTTEISIDFDYVFLKWQEYPPDASHGFYIGSSVITSLLPLAKNYTGIPQKMSYLQDSFNASEDGYFVQLRTESMIITLPTPDFSMPYNVICLTCTVVALAFGPIHNITTKRLRLNKFRQKSLLAKLLLKVLRWRRHNREEPIAEFEEEEDEELSEEDFEENPRASSSRHFERTESDISD